jgi:uncharacterized protein involved in exopolysaccharide biosynthesis
MALFRRKKKVTVRGGDVGAAPVQTQSYSQAPRAADLTVGDYANGMPNIRLGEMLKSFGRQLIWVVPLFLIGSLLAWKLTEDFKRTYTGDARILVQIGDEYVYQPVTGEAGQAGLTITADTIALNEVGLIKNSEIIEQVFGEMTSETSPYAERFDRRGFAKLRRAGGNEKLQIEARAEMLRKMDKAFMVAPRPKSSIIDLAYKHEDGEVAVATLNALILAYQSYRRQIFVEGTAGIIAERRKETEKQLSQNERAIARFLAKNNISDFDSEQGGVRKRTEELRAALNLLRAQMSETETALATVENQLRSTPREINLYVDDRASARVSQAELELKQLLAKYLPTSDPVRQKRAELAELKSLQTSNGGRALGGRRVGPNTVHQALLTRRNTLQATADSYREKEFTLQRQLDSADNKVRRLTALSPDYASLLRERDTLDERLKSYNAKEQEALVNQQQAEATNENVKVISWPKFPRKGRNTRLIAAAGVSFAWGLTLFMLALLRVFLDPRLYAAPTSPRSARATHEPSPEYIPEPVAPQNSYVAPVAPAVQPAAASYEPQPYEPSYDTAIQGQSAMQGQYGQQSYASAVEGSGQQSYAQSPYASAPMMNYGQNPLYQGQETQMQQDPYGQAQPAYGQNHPATFEANGSAALDIYNNPYLSGQTEAGAIDQNLQPGQAPYNPNAPQG